MVIPFLDFSDKISPSHRTGYVSKSIYEIVSFSRHLTNFSVVSTALVCRPDNPDHPEYD